MFSFLLLHIALEITGHLLCTSTQPNLIKKMLETPQNKKLNKQHDQAGFTAVRVCHTDYSRDVDLPPYSIFNDFCVGVFVRRVSRATTVAWGVRQMMTLIVRAQSGWNPLHLLQLEPSTELPTGREGSASSTHFLQH